MIMLITTVYIKITLSGKDLTKKIASKFGDLNKPESQLTFVLFLIGNGMISMRKETT